MPAITDITWVDLNTGLNILLKTDMTTQYIEHEQSNTDPSDEIPDDFTNYPVNLRLDLLLGDKDDPNYDPTNGVIKALTKLLDAARIAQEAVNQGVVAGERLSAFPPMAVGATTNGLTQVTRSVVARHDLFTTNRIIGTNV